MLNYDNTGVTVELGDLIDSGFELWNFEYPVPRKTIQYNGKTCSVDFDKERLQKKIEDHYRFRQIGQETPARFRHYLQSRMREIMPYYVQVYEFDAKFRNIEDPLESYNLLETFTQETENTGSLNASNTSQSSGTSSSESTGTNNKTSKFSDTPQGSVSNLDSYLTNATVDTGGNSSETSGSDSTESSGASEQSSQDNGRTTHTLNRRGNIGVQPLGGEVQNIRAAFINIDMQIVEELSDLFLMIY